MEFEGSKHNNLILIEAPEDVEFAPWRQHAIFKDANPDCEPDARYKGLILSAPPPGFRSTEGLGLYAMKSSDGVRFSLMSDRLDITEECVRLRAHIDAFRDALNGSVSAGRKLNFIVQEMHREVNTIGSKSNDFSISQLSVELKEELEKIREQVQNIQ